MGVGMSLKFLAVLALGSTWAAPNARSSFVGHFAY
jgi:hypothetical protein